MDTNIKGQIFKNNKTGGRYFVVGLAVNTTNAQDGQDMVLYQKIKNGNLVSNQTFCREYLEFKDRFIPD